MCCGEGVNAHRGRRSTSWATAACRCFLALAVSAAIWRQETLNELVVVVYRRLLASSCFRHDSFEVLLSSFTFALTTGAWYVVDRWLLWARKYRILQSKAALEDLSAYTNGNRLMNEIPWYIAPLVVFDVAFPRRHLRLMDVEAPSFARLTLEVIAGVIMYDFLFFLSHLLLHRVPWLYRNVHAKHHVVAVLRASEAIRHTFIDGSLNVLISITTLNLLRLHPLSRAVYDVVVVSMLVESHCGYNCPWMLHNVVPWGILGGPVRHEAHHRTGGLYYQQFFTYLDDAVAITKSWRSEKTRSSSSKNDGRVMRQVSRISSTT